MAVETDECFEWPFGLGRGGYGKLYYEGRTTAPHMVSCERVHGARPTGHQAAHNCGNPSCFNARHLRWATPVENEADKQVHGTVARGEQARKSKLTETDVLSIRATYKSGEVTQRSLAKRFGVSQRTVASIVRRLTWTHV